jgi:hypothetical protein
VKSIALRLLFNDNGQYRYNLESSKGNWKYIQVKDIQIERIGVSPSIPDLMKSAMRGTNKVNLHSRSSVHYAKEYRKELILEYSQFQMISVRGIRMRETESRLRENNHRSGQEDKKNENSSELKSKPQKGKTRETVKPI